MVWLGAVPLGLLQVASVFAAAAVEGLEPGRIEQQIEQVPLPAREPAVMPLPAGPATRIDLREHGFTLAGVLVEGSTVYSNLDFLEVYRPWLGRPVSVSELGEIAEAITRRYQQDGWMLSSALVPAQSVEFGIVRIRVVEGHLTGWRFHDGAPPDRLIDRMLRPALEERPLRRATLIAALRRINALPGLTVTPELRPVAGEAGGHELVLGASSRRFDGAVTLDNRGSELIGPARAVLALGLHGVTGHHESLRLRLATASPTDELRFAEVATDWPIGVEGLRLQLAASLIRSRPGGDLEPFAVRIANDRQRIGLTRVLRSLPHAEARVDARLEAYRSRTDALGTWLLDDRLHSLSVTYDAVRVDAAGARRSVTFGLHRGLAFGGSRVLDARTGAGAGEVDFTRFTAGADYRRPLGERWELSAAAEGQYAFDELPSAERYSLGGGRFGAAYDPSEVSGDHALAGRLEIARRARSGPRMRFSPYAAWDAGAVWNIAATREDRISLASLAAGLRIAGGDATATIEIARPLTRPAASDAPDREARIFATLGYRF